MFTRRELILGSGAMLSFGRTLAPEAAWALPEPLLTPEPVSAARQTSVSTAPSGSRIIAMTFDDGPHPHLTPRLLDILKARNIRATFFVIGRNAARFPDLLRRMADEGHEIGNHTWSHPVLRDLGPAEILEELDRTSEAVYRAVRRIPVTMRPPYGKLTPDQREMVITARDMPTILWSVDPEDWRRPGADMVEERILAGAKPGAIVLSHDTKPGTIEAMPATLDRLAARGYRFSTISMALGQTDWTKLRWGLPDRAKAKG